MDQYPIVHDPAAPPEEVSLIYFLWLFALPQKRGAGWAELISMYRDMHWNESLWTELFLTRKHWNLTIAYKKQFIFKNKA